VQVTATFIIKKLVCKGGFKSEAQQRLQWMEVEC
jgi:hypothetical protein